MTENSKDEDKNNLLREVVKFDLRRILSRLQSKHGKKLKRGRKQAPIPQLNAAINEVSLRPVSKIERSALVNIQARGKELQVLFKKLESLPLLDVERHDIHAILMKIVTEAHDLTLDPTLGTVIRSSSVLDTRLKTSLPEVLGKIGRYYATASELICAARDRKCRVFLKVGIEPCQIEVPREFLLLDGPVSIQKAVDDLFPTSGRSQGSKSILKGRLVSSPSRLDAKFNESMAETIRVGRVHAEIKILFFYELHPRGIRPRVICSSKSACYLCNLFIYIHGEFFTPRTHGRLYEKWMLPDWLQDIPADRRQNLSSAVSRMNTLLEEKIRTESMEKRKPYFQPNESVLVAPAHWPSTSELPEKSIVSSSSAATLRQAITTIQENGTTGDHNTPEKPFEYPSDSITQPVPGYKTIKESYSGTTTPVLEQHSPDRISVIEEDDTSLDTSSSTTPVATAAHITHSNPQTPYQALTRGELLWKQLKDNENPLAVSTQSVHTIISPPTTITAPNHWVQLKWLHPDEQPNVSSTVIHLKDLPSGVDVSLTEVETLYLCHAKDIISITYSPDGPE